MRTVDVLDKLKDAYQQAVATLLSKWGDIYPPLLKAVVALLAAVVILALCKQLLKRARRSAKRYEFVRAHDEIFSLIHRALFLVILFVAGIYIVNLFKIPILERLFYAALIILLALPVKDFVSVLLRYLEENLVRKTASKMDDIVFDLLNKFSGIIAFALAVLFALDVLGINVIPLVAGAGVAGIAVGFAAKDTLSNLIAGILLIIDRPFEIGDRIEVWSAPINSATWGDVIDIGLRATKIKTTDNIVIIIPNNQIMTRDIVNYTTISDDIRVRIPIGVSYDTDIKKAKSVILEVAKTAEWVLKNPPPKVVVRQFGESSVDLQLRVWIRDARRRMDTISYMTDRVKEIFDKEGIEIPYPKRDITVTQTSGTSKG